MLVETRVRWDDDSQNTYVITGGHSVRTELQGRGMAVQQWHIVPRTSAKQLGLGRVHLETISCHPVADVHCPRHTDWDELRWRRYGDMKENVSGCFFSEHSVFSAVNNLKPDLKMGVIWLSRFRSLNHSISKTVLNLLEAIYLRLRKITVTVVKFCVDNIGSDGTDCFRIEVRTDTAEFTDMRI